VEEPQKRVSRKWLKWLEDEVAVWKADGVIDEDQAGTILLRYEEVRKTEETERGGRLVTILTILGAVLLGIGAIIFFASNWQAIPKWFKVALIISSIIAAYTAGYLLVFTKQTYPKVGQALIFLGSIFYGSGIWLIAQIFHINAHYPNGVLFWALGIIPVALVAGSVPILLEASLLLILWTIFEQGQFGSINLLYLPLAAVMLTLSYKLRSRLAVGIGLFGLVLWLSVACGGSFRSDEAILFVFLLSAVAGLLIFALGRLQSAWSRSSLMKTSYRIVGLLVFFFSLYLLTFQGLVRIYRYSRGGAEGSVFFMAAFSIIAICALGAAALNAAAGKNNAGQHKSMLIEAALVFIATFVLAALALLGPAAGEKGLLITTNLLLFLAIITVVISGYMGRDEILINIGLVFFVLDIIARYFDFFWDMLDKSLFFMGGGILLLAGGFLLERNRRKIIREMKVKTYEA
jgi:uncharacterized membrane protein